MFLWSFDVNSFMISLFLSFKAIKAKKATYLARNVKLDWWMDTVNPRLEVDLVLF